LILEDALPARHNLANEAQHSGLVDQRVQGFQQDRMIDGREVFDDIQA
jgi:hypothetical protein